MPSDHHFTINGVRWLVRFTRLRGDADGWAYPPDARNPKSPKKILIDERLSGRRRLETILHEFIHVAFPTTSEEHVTESARDWSRALHALGYRESP